MNLSLRVLAKAADMDPGNLSRLEQGSSGYSEDGIKKIAKALNVSVGVLFSEPAMVEAAALRIRQVPLLQLSQVSAWRGPDLVDFDDDQEYLHTQLTRVSRHGFALRVADEANTPLLQMGDDLIFEPNKQPRMGDVVVATDINGQVYIGRFRQLPGTSKPPAYEVITSDSLYPTGFSLSTPGLRLCGILVEHRRYPA